MRDTHLLLSICGTKNNISEVNHGNLMKRKVDTNLERINVYHELIGRLRVRLVDNNSKVLWHSSRLGG